MHIKRKINYTKYFIFSVPSTVICAYLANGLVALYVTLLIYIATLLNQVILVECVNELTNNHRLESKKLKNNPKILGLFVAKVVILFMALILGSSFIGKKIIFPLMNYVVLIFVLMVSIEKKVEQ